MSKHGISKHGISKVGMLKGGRNLALGGAIAAAVLAVGHRAKPAIDLQMQVDLALVVGGTLVRLQLAR